MARRVHSTLYGPNDMGGKTMKKLLILILASALVASCAHLRESGEIDTANTVRGTVGSATVTDGVIKSRPQDFLIEAALTGDVFETGSLPDEDKDTLVVILQSPDGAGTDGDFHLKTNLTFDFGMRAGEVSLTRVQ